MKTNDSLSLPEEILLLALRDEEGTIEMGSMYTYAIGGAVLAELVMRNRVRLESHGKKRLVALNDPKPIDKPFLDDCLIQVRESRKKRSAQDWVTRFANTKQLKDRLATQLCEQGILRADEDKVLLLFTRRIYPEVDSGPERELVERLHQAISSYSNDLAPRTVALVSLAHHAGLLKNAFDKKDLKDRKRRIEQIINGEATGQATKEAIEAVQAAVMVACILPAITSAAVH